MPIPQDSEHSQVITIYSPELRMNWTTNGKKKLVTAIVGGLMKKPLTLWTYPGNTEGGVSTPTEAMRGFEKDIYGRFFTLTPHRFETN